MAHNLTVVGAAGRMGKRIVALALESEEFKLVEAIESEEHHDLGKDAGIIAGAKFQDISVTDTFEESANADIVIEFSLPEASSKTIEFCASNNIPLVMGTTGLSAEQQQAIQKAAKTIPVIYGTNMSVGMNVLFSLVAKAAAMLGDEYDVEIVEQHHRFKKDAPSGSALTLAENVCNATGRDFPGCLVDGRSGKDALRKQGEIGMHAVRAGDIVGVHDVFFTTLGETVKLNHNAHSRDGFAKGALRAASWLIDKQPGTYTMADVLGIK